MAQGVTAVSPAASLGDDYPIVRLITSVSTQRTAAKPRVSDVCWMKSLLAGSYQSLADASNCPRMPMVSARKEYR